MPLPSDPDLENYFSRSCWLLADVCRKLTNHPDPHLEALSCRISDFFSEAYPWLRDRLRHSETSSSSAPVAATPGVDWKAPSGNLTSSERTVEVLGAPSVLTSTLSASPVLSAPLGGETAPGLSSTPLPEGCTPQTTPSSSPPSLTTSFDGNTSQPVAKKRYSVDFI